MPMRLLPVFILALALTGCFDDPSAQAAREARMERERTAGLEADRAATEALASVAAPAADIGDAPGVEPDVGASSDAEAFVRWLYAGMSSGEIELTSADDASSVWTAENARQFQALSDADRAFLTENPLCGCDDPARIEVRSVAVTPTGPNTADARVSLAGAGFAEVTLILVRQADGWRLADIES